LPADVVISYESFDDSVEGFGQFGAVDVSNFTELPPPAFHGDDQVR
jgi:hypothetical protein